MTDAGPARQMSNLQLRVISSVVLIVAVLTVTWFGGVAFRILSAAIAGAMFYEWCAMSRSAAGAAAGSRHQLVAAVLLGVVLLALALGYSAAGVLVLLALSVLASLLDCKIGGQGSWAPAGLAYAGLSGVSLAWLRDGDQAGLLAILFLFAVVWATDIAAYFVGRSLGGPKLAPSISPGKTQSGASSGRLPSPAKAASAMPAATPPIVPPMAPLWVLPGEIDGASFGPPSERPTK